MSNLFNKIKTSARPAEKLVEPRLTLAAFGKHPGWNDHIPGIGIETETLARIKQTLYVDGIGGQIDSGAWEKLNPEKRADGFDHTFLWIQRGHLALGRLWSSTDGKGRSKYPMVLCLDSEGVSSAFALTILLPGLENLCGACKMAASAEQVTEDCRMAQERFWAQLGRGAPPIETPNAAALRRQFLEHREFRPDRIGLQRVLYELASFSGGTSSGSNAGSRHVRVPMAADSQAEALLLWSDFIDLAVSPGTAVLLICRHGVDWLDAVIGEVQGPDFFFLQASLKALPLTSEIPYELPGALKRRLAELETEFAGVVPPPAKREEAPVSAQSVTRIEKPDTPAAVPRRKRTWAPPLLVGLILLAGVAGYWFYPGTKMFKLGLLEQKPSLSVPSGQQSVKARESIEPEKNYAAAMKAGWAALERQDYLAAASQAAVALSIKTNDLAAGKLKKGALARQQELVVQAQRQEIYSNAIVAGQLAFTKHDFRSAMEQADFALGIRTNDPVAAKLQAEAKSQADLAAERQAIYETAIQAAGAALARLDYAGVITNADAALGIQTNDAAAVKLKADAQSKQAQAALELERQRKLNAALNEASAAFERKDYSNVTAKADVVLLQTNDATAAKLKSETQTALQTIAMQVARAQSYTSFISAAQSDYRGKDYANAIAHADAALKFRSGDATAIALKKQANDDRDLQEAQASIDRGDFDKAKSLCSAHTGTAAFDELAKHLQGKQLDELDINFERYLVWFGLLKPENASTKDGREAKKLPEGDLGSQREDLLKQVEILRAAFNASKGPDKVREKKLDDLKRAISIR